MSAGVVSASHFSAKNRKTNVKLSAHHLHLQLEKQRIGMELVTNYPAREKRIFAKDLDLLLMNG